MARGQQKTRKRNNRTKKSVSRSKNRRGRRGVVVNRQSSSGSLGTMIHHGLRSVLSLLPGASITNKIADLVFNTLSNGVEISPGVMESSVYALYTAFYLTPASLMGNIIAGSSVIDTSNANPEARRVTTNYDSFRISHFKISARNTSIDAKGIWGIGFWPFVNQDDVDNLRKNVYYMADIRLAPHYVEGPASQPLTLRHYFTPNERKATEPGNVTVSHGIVAIAYTDVSRDTYGRISADVFKPQIELSGNVVMSSRMPNKTKEFQNVITQITSVDAVHTTTGIYYSSGPVTYHDMNSHMRLEGNFVCSRFDLDQYEMD